MTAESPFTFTCHDPFFVDRDIIEKQSAWVSLFNLSERDFQSAVHDIWLDHLPAEVTLRIVQNLVHICNAVPETRYVSLLQLADVSRRQSLAVKQALNFHVQLSGDDYFCIRLAGLMRDDAKAVECHEWKGAPDVVLPLLGAGGLEKASVPYQDAYLRELSVGKTRVLRVTGVPDFSSKFAFVKMESVVELSVQFIGLDKTEQMLSSLVDNFPNVKRLELDCKLSYLYKPTGDIEGLPLLARFQQLTMLRTSLPLRVRNTALLRRWPHVEWVGGQDSCFFRRVDNDLLGADVFSGIETPIIAYMLPYSQPFLLSIFEPCTRLKRLHLQLHEGIFDLPLLPALKSLKLMWFAQEQVKKVPAEFLGKLVQMRDLREVQLQNVSTTVENVAWLLQKLNLDVLGVSMAQLSAEQTAFVTGVMRAVVHMNPSLERLCFFRCSYWNWALKVVPLGEPAGTHGVSSSDGVSRNEWESELKRDIAWMICLLERRTNVKNLHELRTTFENWR